MQVTTPLCEGCKFENPPKKGNYLPLVLGVLVKRGRHGMVDKAGTADEWFEARNMVGATNKRGYPTIRIWIQILFGFFF